MILFCVDAKRGLTHEDMAALEELKYFNKAVHIVLTKIDRVRDQETILQRLAETSLAVGKYDYFVKPEIHVFSAKWAFGIDELRARVSIGFELNNYNQSYKMNE